jgi:CrcB protein
MNIPLLSLLAISAGAAIGACCRWFFSLMLNHYLPNLPLGTLFVNVLGGLFAGIVLALVGFGWFESQHLRLFVTTGLLGGLTTFSTFTIESLTLFHKHEYFWAILHTSSHVVTALLFAAVGYAMIQHFFQH